MAKYIYNLAIAHSRQLFQEIWISTVAKSSVTRVHEPLDHEEQSTPTRGQYEPRDKRAQHARQQTSTEGKFARYQETTGDRNTQQRERSQKAVRRKREGGIYTVQALWGYKHKPHEDGDRWEHCN
jgi:hypothetical protein